MLVVSRGHWSASIAARLVPVSQVGTSNASLIHINASGARAGHDPVPTPKGISAMVEQRHTGNRGNFAEDREKASRAGHIGGLHSSGNFAQNRERAAAAGRKGGESSGASGRTRRAATSGGPSEAGSGQTSKRSRR